MAATNREVRVGYRCLPSSRCSLPRILLLIFQKEIYKQSRILLGVYDWLTC